MKYLFTFLALIIGFLLAIQGSINTQLTTYLKHPFQGALVSFSVGTIALIGLNIIFRTGFPEIGVVKNAPWYLFLGGVLGALFVSSVIFFIPKIGVTTMMGAAIAGQLIAGSIIDHFGLFGVQVHPFSLGRAIGILLLLSGIFLVQKF